MRMVKMERGFSLVFILATHSELSFEQLCRNMAYILSFNASSVLFPQFVAGKCEHCHESTSTYSSQIVMFDSE